MRKLTLILLMSCSVAVIRADLRDTFHSISKHPLGHYITYEEALQKKLLKGSPEICVGDASMPGSSSAYGCCMGTDANSPCFFSTPEMSTLLKNFLSRPLIQPLDDPLTFLSNDITPYVAQRFKRDTSNSTSVKTKRHDRAEGNRFRQGKLGGFGFRGNGEEQRRGHDDDKEDRDDGEHKEDGEHRKDGERKGHRGRHEHEEHRGNEEEDEVEEEGGVQEEEGGGDEEEGEAENEEGEAEEEEGEAEEEEDAVEDSEDEGQEDEGGEGYEESEEIVEESAENTYDYESEGSDRGGFEDELNRHGRSFKKNFRKCHSKVNHEYEHWAKQATNALQEAPDGYSPRFFELCPVKTSVVYPREAQSCDASEGTDWLRAVPVLQCPGAYMPIEIVECDWSLVEVISQFICGIRCVQQYSLVQVMSQDPESLTMRWPFVQRASGCAAFIDYDGVITESEGENDDNSNADESENLEDDDESSPTEEGAEGDESGDVSEDEGGSHEGESEEGESEEGESEEGESEEGESEEGESEEGESEEGESEEGESEEGESEESGSEDAEDENKELPEENESEVESAQGEGASEDREPASGEGDTAEVSNVKVNISMESPASFPGELPEADDSTHIVLPIDYSSVNRRKEAKFFNDDQRQRGKYNYDKDFIADRGNPKIIGIGAHGFPLRFSSVQLNQQPDTSSINRNVEDESKDKNGTQITDSNKDVNRDFVNVVGATKEVRPPLLSTMNENSFIFPTFLNNEDDKEEKIEFRNENSSQKFPTKLELPVSDPLALNREWKPSSELKYDEMEHMDKDEIGFEKNEKAAKIISEITDTTNSKTPPDFSQIMDLKQNSQKNDENQREFKVSNRNENPAQDSSKFGDALKFGSPSKVFPPTNFPLTSEDEKSAQIIAEITETTNSKTPPDFSQIINLKQNSQKNDENQRDRGEFKANNRNENPAQDSSKFGDALKFGSQSKVFPPTNVSLTSGDEETQEKYGSRLAEGVQSSARDPAKEASKLPFAGTRTSFQSKFNRGGDSIDEPTNREENQSGRKFGRQKNN